MILSSFHIHGPVLSSMLYTNIRARNICKFSMPILVHPVVTSFISGLRTKVLSLPFHASICNNSWCTVGFVQDDIWGATHSSSTWPRSSGRQIFRPSGMKQENRLFQTPSKRSTVDWSCKICADYSYLAPKMTDSFRRPLPFECTITPRFPEAAAIIAQTKELLG